MNSLQHHLHQKEICLASLDDVVAFLRGKKKNPYSFHSCNIYPIRYMLTLSIYRFLKESFETFKNGCNFCFHKEGIEEAKWHVRERGKKTTSVYRVPYKSLGWLLNVYGRLTGVYLHSLLKAYNINNNIKIILKKQRIGEKIATGKRKQQGFRRGKTSGYLLSRGERTGNPLPGEERSHLEGEMDEENLGKTWSWEALGTSDGQCRLGWKTVQGKVRAVGPLQSQHS